MLGFWGDFTRPSAARAVLVLNALSNSASFELEIRDEVEGDAEVQVRGVDVQRFGDIEGAIDHGDGAAIEVLCEVDPVACGEVRDGLAQAARTVRGKRWLPQCPGPVRRRSTA